MEKSIKALYKASLKDELFAKELAQYDSKNRGQKPNFFSAEAYKYFYGMCYYGWYLGKYGVQEMNKAFPSNNPNF